MVLFLACGDTSRTTTIHGQIGPDRGLTGADMVSPSAPTPPPPPNNFDKQRRINACDNDAIIKNWIVVLCNSRDLVDLAAMVYEPLYHSQEIETIKIIVFWLFSQSKISKI